MTKLRGPLSKSYTGEITDVRNIKGSFLSVPTVVIRNAIPAYQRQKDGNNEFLVYVHEDQSIYRLKNNPTGDTTTNSDWDLIFTSALSGLVVQGSWDASTNTPTLSDATAPEAGQAYYVWGVPNELAYQYAGLFNGVLESFLNGYLVVSNGSRWVVVKNNAELPIPIELIGTDLVADITARNAVETWVGKRVIVLDATGDESETTADGETAEYLYDPNNVNADVDGWIAINKIELAGFYAEAQTQAVNYSVTAGTSTALTADFNPDISVVVEGQPFRVKLHTTVGASPTLDMGDGNALPLVKSINGVASTAVTQADAKEGQTLLLVKNTVNAVDVYELISSAGQNIPNTEVVIGTGNGITSNSNFTFDGTTATVIGNLNVVGQADIDNVQINSNTISVTNTNGNLILSANGTGIVDIQSPVTVNSLSVDADLTVTGNLTVNGTTTTINTATVQVEDNLIVVNYGELGVGVTAGTAGIEVERGSLTNYQFLFDESDDLFKIGEVGSLQVVATRENTPTDTGIAIWNTTAAQHQTSGNLVFTANSLDVNTDVGEDAYIGLYEVSGYANLDLGSGWTLATFAGVGATDFAITNNSTGENVIFIEEGNQITITDVNGGLGMQYAGDYSTNNAANDRWIVDKGYVDTEISNGLSITANEVVYGNGTGITSSSTFTFNGTRVTLPAAGELYFGTGGNQSSYLDSNFLKLRDNSGRIEVSYSQTRFVDGVADGRTILGYASSGGGHYGLEIMSAAGDDRGTLLLSGTKDSSGVLGSMDVGDVLRIYNYQTELMNLTYEGVLEYKTDVSANYSVRSLVDKKYVDDAILNSPTLQSVLDSGNTATISGSTPITLTREEASNNTVIEVARFDRTTSDVGNGADGIGSSIALGLPNSANLLHDLTIKHILSDTTNGIEDSTFQVSGFLAGNERDFINIASGTDNVILGPADDTNVTTNNVYIGFDQVRNASSSVVIGERAEVGTGGFSTVIGHQAKGLGTVSGEGPTVVGYAAEASARRSIAIGARAGVTAGSKGSSHISIGYGSSSRTTNIGENAIEIGYGSEAQANHTITMGPGVKATAVGAHAYGRGSLASAQGAITMGYNSVIDTHDNATADSFMLAWDGDTIMHMKADEGLSITPRDITVAADSQKGISFTQTLNDTTIQAGADYTGFYMNLTETDITGWADGVLLIDLQVDGSSVFNVQDDGTINVNGSPLDFDGTYIDINSTGTAASATGTDAIAIGETASAIGVNSIAIGSASTSNTDNSITLGYNSSSTGTSSVAIGASITTTGASVGIGSSSSATGTFSIAIGRQAMGTGADAIVFGTNANSSTSTGVIAIGRNTGVTAGSVSNYALDIGYKDGLRASNLGIYSIGLGFNAYGSGNNSVAIGTDSLSSGVGSIAIGRNMEASGVNAIILGNDINTVRTNTIDDSFMLNWGGTTSIHLKKEVVAATGDEVLWEYNPIVNKATSGNYTALKIDVTDTNSPAATNYLIDLQVGGATVFNVEDDGTLNINGTGSTAIDITTSAGAKLYLSDLSTELYSDNANGAEVQIGFAGGFGILYGTYDSVNSRVNQVYLNGYEAFIAGSANSISIGGSTTSTSANGTWVIGTPTGGAQAAGTLNAEGLYVNGVAVTTGATTGNFVFSGNTMTTGATAGAMIIESNDNDIIALRDDGNPNTYHAFSSGGAITTGGEGGNKALQRFYNNTAGIDILNIEYHHKNIDDVGDVPLTQYTVYKDSTAAAIGTRPIFAWYNFTTKVAEVSAGGDWDYQGNNLSNIGQINDNLTFAGTLITISNSLTVSGNATFSGEVITNDNLTIGNTKTGATTVLTIDSDTGYNGRVFFAEGGTTKWTVGYVASNGEYSLFNSGLSSTAFSIDDATNEAKFFGDVSTNNVVNRGTSALRLSGGNTTSTGASIQLNHNTASTQGDIIFRIDNNEVGRYDFSQTRWEFDDVVISGSLTSGNATFSGDITVTGTGTATDWDTTSDARLKHNWNHSLDYISMVNSIANSAGTFQWKSNDKLDFGISAQDVQTTMPWIVKGDDELSVSYGKIGVAVAVIASENRSRLEILEDKVQRMQKLLDDNGITY